jgi:hypothetical protein
MHATDHPLENKALSQGWYSDAINPGLMQSLILQIVLA